MKVVQINAVYGYGSTGLIVKDIAEAVEADGGEARIAYQYAAPIPEDGFRIGNKIDWKLHALYTRMTGKQAFASRAATKRLLRYLREEKPDVVHLHNLHANYINLPLLLEYLTEEEIATVITLHDCWFFTGKCTHFAAEKCEAWRSGCGNCPKQFEPPASLICDASAEVLQKKVELYERMPKLTVVGCSKWISDLAKKSRALKNCRVTQIYNGVDTAIFAPMDREKCRSRYGIKADFVILGMANKWLDQRNQNILNKISRQLQENELLILIGCSEEQKKIASGYDRVRAVGFIEKREELAEYYNAADVFCNLTFEDTLPTVNMEAISCGTPVITYDSCGSPELIENGNTGYVIRQLDQTELEKAFQNIRSGTISRKACRSYALNFFEKTARYQEYLNLYRSFTSQGRSRECYT